MHHHSMRIEHRQQSLAVSSQYRTRLAITQTIVELLEKLRTLHASHPFRTKADELLARYKDVVLPFPPIRP
jgi:hypothetical protein